MTAAQRAVVAAACVVFGFLVVVTLRIQPPNPEVRLPRQERLVALIQRQRTSTATLREEVDRLRGEVEALRRTGAAGAPGSEAALQTASLSAGMTPVEGPGLRVTLDDSTLEESPTGNVNDLVVHSSDVQAVVNALWRSGAEAVAINGQRLVGTSAVLCVGNTLLLNGTVHAPPYVAVGLGASKARFDGDALVRRLRRDAEALRLRLSVEEKASLRAPGYRGAVAPRYAKAVRARSAG